MRICSECGKETKVFTKQRCANCYKKYWSRKRQEAAPKVKCQCSPDCQTMIPSIDFDGKPMRVALYHGLKGANNIMWNGGRMTRNGYWYLLMPKHHQCDKDGYVAEHRYVYEQYHKCCILPWIVIHHINGKKKDNRPENLDILRRSKHQNHHNPRKGYKKDVSGRICLECGSDKTQPSKNGQPHWCRHPITKAEWICETCYRRLVRNLRRPKRTELNRICLLCGTDKSENKMGHLTWRKYEDGYICKICFDNLIRVRKK